MFKFMKSKKGFSLVELMIVVVIMAILVAVAVPIFNSVTGSSRAKTCIDNQRSIISTLNTALLEKSLASGEKFVFQVTNVKSTGVKGYTINHTGTTQKGTNFLSVADLNGLFQTVPYCPVDDSEITVTITGTADGTCTITTLCEDSNGLEKDPHILKKS